VRAAVGLGNDGRAALSDLTVTTIAFDQGAGRIAITRGLERDELPAPVRAMRIRYLAEDGWQDAFASDEAGAFPVGIEVSVWFDRGASADFADPADSAAAVVVVSSAAVVVVVSLLSSDEQATSPTAEPAASRMRMSGRASLISSRRSRGGCAGRWRRGRGP
jgi:hypothetical protein